MKYLSTLCSSWTDHLNCSHFNAWGKRSCEKPAKNTLFGPSYPIVFIPNPYISIYHDDVCWTGQFILVLSEHLEHEFVNILLKRSLSYEFVNLFQNAFKHEQLSVHERMLVLFTTINYQVTSKLLGGWQVATIVLPSIIEEPIFIARKCSRNRLRVNWIVLVVLEVTFLHESTKCFIPVRLDRIFMIIDWPLSYSTPLVLREPQFNTSNDW